MAGDIATMIECYLESSRACGHSEGTLSYRRVYLGQLQRSLLDRGILHIEEVTAKVLATYTAYLVARQTRYKRKVASRLSSRTVETQVSVLRSFFVWLTKSGRLPANPADGLRVKRGEAPPSRRILTVEEAERLMRAPRGLR